MSERSRCAGLRKNGNRCLRRAKKAYDREWYCHSHVASIRSIPNHTRRIPESLVIPLNSTTEPAITSEKIATSDVDIEPVVKSESIDNVAEELNSSHGEEFRSFPEGKDLQTCAVCMELIDRMERHSADLSCKHPLCLECAKQLRDDKCPVCRGPIRLGKSKLSVHELNEIKRKHNRDNIQRNNTLSRQYIEDNETYSDDDQIFLDDGSGSNEEMMEADTLRRAILASLISDARNVNAKYEELFNSVVCGGIVPEDYVELLAFFKSNLQDYCNEHDIPIPLDIFHNAFMADVKVLYPNVAYDEFHSMVHAILDIPID